MIQHRAAVPRPQRPFRNTSNASVTRAVGNARASQPGGERPRRESEEPEPENALGGVDRRQKHAEGSDRYAGGDELRQESHVKDAYLWIENIRQKTPGQAAEADFRRLRASLGVTLRPPLFAEPGPCRVPA
jgi:hypothetical protein